MKRVITSTVNMHSIVMDYSLEKLISMLQTAEDVRNRIEDELTAIASTVNMATEVKAVPASSNIEFYITSRAVDDSSFWKLDIITEKLAKFDDADSAYREIIDAPRYETHVQWLKSL